MRFRGLHSLVIVCHGLLHLQCLLYHSKWQQQSLCASHIPHTLLEYTPFQLSLHHFLQLQMFLWSWQRVINPRMPSIQCTMSGISRILHVNKTVKMAAPVESLTSTNTIVLFPLPSIFPPSVHYILKLSQKALSHLLLCYYSTIIVIWIRFNLCVATQILTRIKTGNNN